MHRASLSLLATAAIAAGAALPIPSAQAQDGFTRASSETRAALKRIATRDGLRGTYAYLRKGSFAVVCGRRGAEYGSFVPARRVNGRWRKYDPSSGGLQTYQAACEKRDPENR